MPQFMVMLMIFIKNQWFIKTVIIQYRYLIMYKHSNQANNSIKYPLLVVNN